MSWIWWVVIVLVVVIAAGFVIIQFNRLRRLDVLCTGALGDIDTLLTKRADLVPNLVETVRGAADFESSTIEAVTAARTRTGEARDLNEKSSADAALTSALGRLFAVAEAYPQLTATSNFQTLQVQLADVEGQLQFARQYYNDSVVNLNTALRTIPSMWFAGLASVSQREMYAEPDEGRRAAPRVQF
ncbi:MAG: LemA family protein [Actinobacteria bacterium]|nr:LemA family protein [Actinomycetota bacterium]